VLVSDNIQTSRRTGAQLTPVERFPGTPVLEYSRARPRGARWIAAMYDALRTLQNAEMEM